MFNAPRITFCFVFRKVAGRAASALHAFLAGWRAMRFTFSPRGSTRTQQHLGTLSLLQHRKALKNQLKKKKNSILNQSSLPYSWKEAYLCINILVTLVYKSTFKYFFGLYVFLDTHFTKTQEILQPFILVD